MWLTLGEGTLPVTPGEREGRGKGVQEWKGGEFAAADRGVEDIVL
jgi:hypothetical protein